MAEKGTVEPRMLIREEVLESQRYGGRLRVHILGKTRWNVHVLYRCLRPRFRGGSSRIVRRGCLGCQVAAPGSFVVRSVHGGDAKGSLPRVSRVTNDRPLSAAAQWRRPSMAWSNGDPAQLPDAQAVQALVHIWLPWLRQMKACTVPSRAAETAIRSGHQVQRTSPPGRGYGHVCNGNAEAGSSGRVDERVQPFLQGQRRTWRRGAADPAGLAEPPRIPAG